jgi:hypothetical protein
MGCTVNTTKFCLVTATTSVIALIAAEGRAIVDTLAPMGYEDESAFHFGSLWTRSSTSSVRFGFDERLSHKNGRALTASLNKRATKNKH